MQLFRPPYGKLVVGVLIGWLVLPRITARLNLPIGA